MNVGTYTFGRFDGPHHFFTGSGAKLLPNLLLEVGKHEI